MIKRLFLIGLVISAAEGVGEEIPFPPEFNLQVVADDLVHNGLPMTIRRFTTPLEVSQVQAFYREQWQEPVAAGAPGHVEARAGDWHVISRLTPHDNLLVQLRAADQGGTSGFLAKVGREAKQTIGAMSAELPDEFGGELISVTESHDGGHRAITAIYRINVTATAALSQVERHFLAQGLSVQRRFSEGDTEVKFLVGPRGTVDLAIQQDADGPILVINMAER